MTDPSQAATAAPPRGSPGPAPGPAQDDPQAGLRAAVLAAAERGDWPGTLALARSLTPHAGAGPAVNAVVLAALMLHDPGDIAFAAGLVLEAALPPRLRATFAWRFARAGHGTEALAILVADPSSFGAAAAMEPTQRLMVARTLSLLAGNRALEPILRAAVRRHAGRFFGTEPIEPAFLRDRAFGPPGPPPALRGAVPRVHLAPDTPAPFAREAEQALALFGQAAATARPPHLRVYQDVFVNRHGQIWRDAAQLMPGQLADIPPESIAAMAGAPRLTEAVLAIEPNANVYHWFAEWLPSLAWRLNDAAGTIPLLVGDSAPAFIAQSLDLAEAAPSTRIVAGDACFVGRLYVASRETARLANHASYGDLLARIAARAEAAVPAAAAAAPMYLSRRDSPKRAMDNEEALCRALEARGLETVVMSGMPFAAQIARIRRAPLIVAAHGAGLAHLLTARPGTRVLEIVPVLPGSLMMRCCFAKLSWLFGHEHHLWLENANPLTGRWAADVPRITALLDTLGAAEGAQAR